MKYRKRSTEKYLDCRQKPHNNNPLTLRGSNVRCKWRRNQHERTALQPIRNSTGLSIWLAALERLASLTAALRRLTGNSNSTHKHKLTSYYILYYKQYYTWRKIHTRERADTHKNTTHEVSTHSSESSCLAGKYKLKHYANADCALTRYTHEAHTSI